MKRKLPIIPILVVVVVVVAVLYLYNKKVEGFSVMCCPDAAVDANDRCKVRPIRVPSGHECHNRTLPYNKKQYKGAIVKGSYAGVPSGL